MKLPSIQNMTTAQVVRTALLFSAISFTFWIGLCFLAWNGLRLAGFESDFWAMLEAISTAAAVAQFLGGGVVALWQLRDSVDSRNLSIYNDIFEKLMSDRDIEGRRWIYVNLPDMPEQGIAGLTTEGQAHVKQVLNSLDHLGFLLEQDWITKDAEDAIIKWVSPFVVKIWQKIGPYIDYEAKRRREPDYYASIRYLAEHCIKWRAKNIANAGDIVWLKDAL
jgi:hypothetical protein